MTARRPLTALRRADIFLKADGICHICGVKINATRGEPWDVEHVIPLAIGGEDGGDNLKPAHRSCHAVKSKRDAGIKAKTDRLRAKHIGARKPSRWASKWKRKVNGQTVLRSEA